MAANSFAKNFSETVAADIVVCPSYPFLSQVKEIFSGTPLLLGAQDAHHEVQGAFTGDVSISQIKNFVRYAIVGHSERRRYHFEDDALVAKKTRALLRSGLRPLICVGETAEERQAGETIGKIREQVSSVLTDMPILDYPRIVFCYEPVWAISPGLGEEAPQPEPIEVAEVVNLIRRIMADFGGEKYLDKVRILYGGSVTAKTAAQFTAEPGVNGLLIGGASTKPAEFAAIIREVVNNNNVGK